MKRGYMRWILFILMSIMYSQIIGSVGAGQYQNPTVALIVSCGDTYKYGDVVVVAVQVDNADSYTKYGEGSFAAIEKSYTIKAGATGVTWHYTYDSGYEDPQGPEDFDLEKTITMKVPTPTPVSTATPIPTATPATPTPVITATPATPTPVITATPATPTPATMPTAIPTVTPSTSCSLHLSSNSVTVKINNTESVDASGLPTGGDFNSSMSSTPGGSQGVVVVDRGNGTARIIICAGYKPFNYDVEIIYSTSDCSVSDTINVEVVASSKPTPKPSPRPTPDLEDTDEDGLMNFIEEYIKTDPENWDSDYDGWSDGDEHWSAHNPLDPDDHPTEEELKLPQCPNCGRHYNPEEVTHCPKCGYSFDYAKEEY